MNHSDKLLEGSIIRQLLVLATPLLIGNIFQQFYNTVDAVIIGRYIGQEAFAAIGIAGTVMNLFIFLLGGCCTGVSIILARLYGGGKYALFRQECFMANVVGISFALFLSIIAIVFLPNLLGLIQTPTELYKPIKSYLTVIFYGLIITFLYNLYAATLRAVGDTFMALLFLVFAIILNTILDLLFVAVLSFGIAGAAWATVIAQCTAAIGCGIYMRRRMPELVYRKEDKKFHKKLLKETIQFASISAMQQSSLYVGKLLVQGTVNDLGISSISAYTAAGRIEGFINSFGESGADAISIFVAQNIGADNEERAKEGFFAGLKLMLVLLVVFSLGMFTLAKELMFLVLGNVPDAIFIGEGYLKGISFLYFFCFVGAAFVGWYRGSGRVNIPFIGTTIHIVLRVVLSIAFSATMGLKGIAFATGIGWMCTVCFQIIYYLIRGKQSAKKVAKCKVKR